MRRRVAALALMPLAVALAVAPLSPAGGVNDT
jgi:hypothetical protein